MYYLAVFLRKVLLKLPLFFSLLLGELLGLFLYLNSRKRNVSFKNLKSVFPQKTNAELHYICRRSLRNLGLSIVETLIAPKIIEKIEFKGLKNITDKNAIFVGIHAGSWEFYNAAFAKFTSYSVLVKQQKKNKNLDKFLNKLRVEYNINVCFSLKELIKYLKKGHSVGLVIDHGAENNALFINFFSHLVPTPKGAIHLAKKFNKKIYPSFGHREKNFRHILEFSEPIDPEGKTEEALLKQINEVYENSLIKYPQEYLWYYKRFKKKKSIDVVILSDGKTGHFKQSQAFMTFLSEKFHRIRIKNIEVKYKNKASRIIADILALFVGKKWTGYNGHLKLILKQETLKQMENTYADVVISTGSYVAPINYLFSSYLGAKSVTILRPNILLSKFDLSIIPEHDRLETDKAVKIKGALYYPDNPQEKIEKCKDFFKLSTACKISVFFGGPLRNEKEFLENLEIFCCKLKEFSLRKDYKILISTSRRTPRAAEEYIKKEFNNFSNAEAIVYPSQANYDFIFEGFSLLSKIVFVTSESISMISEILSLKKPCVALLLENQVDKHNIFLQSMKNELFLLKKPYDIKKIILRKSSLFEYNKKIVRQAVEQLL